MPDRDERFLHRLLPTFKAEAREHITTIAVKLEELEASEGGARDALVELVFREAHSLKAAARVVEQREMEQICQSVESVFAAFKQGKPVSSPVLIDALREAAAVLEECLGAVEAPSTAARRARAGGVAKALDAALKMAPPAPGPASAPGPAPAPVLPAPDEAGDAPVNGPKGGETAAAQAGAAADTVRLSAHRLDGLLLLAEEMLLEKLTMRRLASELKGLAATDGRLAALAATTDGEARRLGTKVDRLLYEMKQIVTLQCSTALQLFPRAVRELARDQGKEVELVIEGAGLEMDRRILEDLKDPLLHLLRNAIDHGIEPPDERAAAGKRRRARIALSIAAREGSRVEFTISDDGAGIDRAKLADTARKLGLLSPDLAASDADLLPLIFQSGVSTSAMITDVSGRGLGLAIVREKVERLGGTVVVESLPRQGTTFRLTVPLTLATYRGIPVGVGDRLFVLPTLAVERVVRLDRSEIALIENRATISVADAPVPLVALRDVLELPPAPRPEGRLVAVILGTVGRRVAFEVDRVEGDQEILVKPLGKSLVRVRNVQGATMLATGTVAPILNAHDLLKSAARISQRATAASLPEASPAGRKTILLAEDSVTARSLLKNILEAAGYRTRTASDGMEAWTMLKLEPADLVVSDVEMPRMSGFELTARIRSDRELSPLPVVLVTARDSPEDLEKGVDAGANAYITKGGFDQGRLLEAVRRLI